MFFIDVVPVTPNRFRPENKLEGILNYYKSIYPKYLNYY